MGSLRLFVFSMASMGVLVGITTREGWSVAAPGFAIIMFVLRGDIRDALLHRKRRSQ